jgi:methylenetetrahydrofolate dehydrogenase (NADP+) / methenyltetrahydrofolate cyclohydrolase
MVTFIDGKAIAHNIEREIAETIRTFTHRVPGLAFILVGDHPASRTYVKAKKKKCEEVGVLSFDREFSEEITESKLLDEIEHLNNNPAVDGILVQLPLPAHISALRVMEAIDPEKDVDGFHPVNVGKMLLGETDGFFPCTPLGIVVLLAEAKIPVMGKHVVIVGRSNVVGKPLAALLMQKATHCNATVTVVHSYSENLPHLCRQADILVAAMGKPHFITQDMVKKGATVVDVGINRIVKNGKVRLIGDVDTESVASIAAHMTPVPGGVGPMTIVMLLSNTLLSYQRGERV